MEKEGIKRIPVKGGGPPICNFTGEGCVLTELIKDKLDKSNCTVDQLKAAFAALTHTGE
jgi:hypothetical protein